MSYWSDKCTRCEEDEGVTELAPTVQYCDKCRVLLGFSRDGVLIGSEMAIKLEDEYLYALSEKGHAETVEDRFNSLFGGL